jgi:cellulose synthase/poly-beta-1,6-N-acetylglucosamine synthase-like glycosyltransferase
VTPLAAPIIVLLVLAWLPLAGVVLYLCILTIAAARLRIVLPPATPRKHTFRIVVPAHNEEQILAPVLRRIAMLDYPRDRWELVVVADNCSDATATVARAAGARVLERIDASLRGKGHALAFAVDALRAEPFDAYVILDADTLVDPELLDILNRYLDAGHRVIQAHHDVLNPYDTRRTVLMYVAFCLFHYVRPLGRRALGLSTGLNGNGMCFAKPVLEQYSWNAFSLVEDMEYTTMLLRHGERVVFAPEARIRAQMAGGRVQATSQRMRWEGGRLRMA